MRANGDRHIVIDTNIWISAWLSDHGAPAKLLESLPNEVVVVFTTDTFVELESRVWKPKFDRYLSMERRKTLLREVEGMAHWVEVPPGIKDWCYCRDPDDDKFIHAALSADCSWLVSGDYDLLCLDPLDGLRLVSANDALQQIPWLN